ncbi:MAG: SpoIIIAH-like family protein [Tenericutes bacterium]|nr:SpoIIIAH-like family protein [Mycoplasmatota bacterium]
MINKKNIWFLTLFSLILVLSVYYITMPSELLLNNTNFSETTKDNNDDVAIETSNIISALKAEDNESYLKQLDSLKLILMDKEKSVEEKNSAFDQMKELNIHKSEEENIEKQLNETFSLKTFVKIKDDQIKVVVDSSEHDTTIANKIMNLVQSNFDEKMYITVQFK